jgi:hypothetical protein
MTMKKKLLAVLATGVFILGMAGMAGAAIIDLPDVKGIGYFYDTVTKYTWMDVDNAYVGKSFNEAETAIKGTIWQIATYDVLKTMLDQVPGGDAFDHYSKIMGYTTEGDPVYRVIQGNYENGDSSKLSYASAWMIEGDSGWAYVDPIPSCIPGWDGIPWSRDTEISSIGVWVFTKETVCPSTVPIPAAAWLLGSGLVGLFGARKKMRS